MQLDALYAPLDFRVPNRVVWYAEGFRWIASLCESVATHLEHEAATPDYAPEDESIAATRNRLLGHF